MDGAAFQFSTDRRWYAVKAQPRKEALAGLHLRRQGFRAFLPTIGRVVRHPTRVATVQTSFFPGYLFVSLCLALDRWRSVNGTIGVSGLVQFGERPAAAPPGLIEALIAQSTDHGEVRLDDDLDPGDAIRIVGGPFDGISGVFRQKSPQDRVTVLIALLSREVTISVPKAAVMAV